MQKKIMFWAAAWAVMCLCAAAADISGKWVAQIPGRDGATMEQTFLFKVEGTKLTGTVTTQRGEQQISEGTITGDEISFAVVRESARGQMKDLYKGKVSGAEIKFVRTRESGGRGGPVEFVAKKAE